MKRFASFVALTALLVGYGCSKKDSNIEFELGTYTEPYSVPNSKVSPYDPTFESKVVIYYPPGYNVSDTATKYPVAYFLHGYGGDYTYFKDVYDLGTLMSYLIATDSVEPMILVFVNGRNLFYGSFYTNSEYNGSPVFGLHEDYFIYELMPYVERQLLPEHKLNGERYIAGYSMGGYGTVLLASKYPHLFNKAASLSGPLAFAIFTDSTAAEMLFGFLRDEMSLDSLKFVTVYEALVNDSVVYDSVMQEVYTANSGRLPIGIDTLMFLFSKPGDTVVDTVISQTVVGDTVYQVRYSVIHTFAQTHPKRFTMYLTALSAAFTPKADLCSNFSVLDNEYVVAIVDSAAGICAGLRLPVYKNLDGQLETNVMNEWIMDHDIPTLLQQNAGNIAASNLKWYLSSGRSTLNDLETVIYNMNKVAEGVLSQIYGSDFENKVEINYYTGESDPFHFPPTHNQYIYQELGNVLRFFSK